jgi:protein PhnA
LRDSQAGIFDMTVKDSNGNALAEGDSVQVIKDLKVKGSSETLKRGTVFKNIRLTDDEEAIECGQGRNTVVLKTCFLKKA